MWRWLSRARRYFIICELRNYLTRKHDRIRENCSGFLLFTRRAHSLRHAPASGLTSVKIYITGCDTERPNVQREYLNENVSPPQLMSPGYKALTNVTAFLFSAWIANYIKLPALKKFALTRGSITKFAQCRKSAASRHCLSPIPGGYI